VKTLDHEDHEGDNKGPPLTKLGFFIWLVVDQPTPFFKICTSQKWGSLIFPNFSKVKIPKKIFEKTTTQM